MFGLVRCRFPDRIKLDEMNGPVRNIRPGETFYLHGRKLHYIGVAESTEDKVHVFWGWNRYKARRYYETLPADLFWIEWKYMTKTKDKAGRDGP